jgi:hypothetical protein
MCRVGLGIPYTPRWPAETTDGISVALAGSGGYIGSPAHSETLPETAQ